MAKNMGEPALAEAQKLLIPYLDPGEKLIWAERRSFWVSLRAFPLRLLYNFVAVFLLLLVFGVVILPLFFLENSDFTVTSFLLFNFLWLTVFFLEGMSIFRNNVRNLYALSSQRAFFIKVKPFLEIDAISLHHLQEKKIYSYGTAGSLVFPRVRRWGHNQFAFQRNPQLGFYAIPAITRATETLQSALDSAQNENVFKMPGEARLSLALSRTPASLFQRLPISFMEKILNRCLEKNGYKINETILWVSRPEIGSIIFSISFLIRLTASLFFTALLFFSMFFQKAPLSDSGLLTLVFVAFIWLYSVAPIINGLLQTYAFSNKHLYIIRGWLKLSARVIDLTDLDAVQFLRRSGNTGSIGFGVLSQQFSSDEKPILFLNRFGFFHIEKMTEVKTLLQDAILKARRDMSLTPSTPSADREAPAPRGG